jgi:murein DD-endopeptidase MepM/ murein hydrolase activator NlpD
MPKTAFAIAFCGFAVLGQIDGQQVIVEGKESARATVANSKKQTVAHESAPPAVAKESFPKAQSVQMTILKAQPVKAQPVKEQLATAPVTKPPLAKTQFLAAAPPKPQVAGVKIVATAGDRAPSSAQPIKPTSSNARLAKTEPAVSLPPNGSAVTAPVQPKPQRAIAQSSKPAALTPRPGLPLPQNMRLTRVEGPTAEPSMQLPLKTQEAGRRLFASSETAFTKLADGFDFPVGKPDAQGYYKARGFRSHGHMGEDWDGIRGGDTDLGDPIYSIGDGIVVFARDCHMGWGNVMIVRHTYREGGLIKTVDAFYGHLNSMAARRGQSVSRGQKIATMGNAHGLYDAHLHLEIRKNIEIGMSRAAFAQDSSNYYDPSQFIASHRHLQGGGGPYRVAMNTFVRDARINFDAARNYSHARTGGGTRQSAAALKKAVVTKN